MLTMFPPLNKEIGSKKLKSIIKNQEEMKQVYYKFLFNDDIDSVYTLQSKHDENYELQNKIKEYALFNYVSKHDLDIEKYDITKYKSVLLLYTEKMIASREYVKAKKLLNIAKNKEYYCNKYYELLDKINNL